MLVSQKCQYTLRAVFELGKRYGEGPIKIIELAQAQAIPPRFLEVILSQLKQSHIVESQRGRDGGYLLSRLPKHITVGEVLQYMGGEVKPVDCMNGAETCSLSGNCAFLPMWQKVEKAVSDVYDNTTFQDLIDEEAQMAKEYIPGYSI